MQLSTIPQGRTYSSEVNSNSEQWKKQQTNLKILIKQRRRKKQNDEPASFPSLCF